MPLPDIVFISTSQLGANGEYLCMQLNAIHFQWLNYGWLIVELTYLLRWRNINREMAINSDYGFG